MPDHPPSIDDTMLRLDGIGHPVLLGGRDRETGRIAFPPPGDGDRFETIELPRTGTLWSWTVQRFRPKSPPYAGPEAFEPYAVGYIALGDVIIVEARLTGHPIDDYAIDMPMRLVAEPFAHVDGSLRTTYAFAPAGEQG